MPVIHILCQICYCVTMVISTTDTFMSAFTVFWHLIKCSHSLECHRKSFECGVEITGIIFCSKNLFTCFISFINMVGNSDRAAWKCDSRTLYTDIWVVNYQILFSISKQFNYFKCLKHLMKKVFQLYIKQFSVLGDMNFRNSTGTQLM